MKIAAISTAVHFGYHHHKAFAELVRDHLSHSFADKFSLAEDIAKIAKKFFGVTIVSACKLSFIHYLKTCVVDDVVLFCSILPQLNDMRSLGDENIMLTNYFDNKQFCALPHPNLSP